MGDRNGLRMDRTASARRLYKLKSDRKYASWAVTFAPSQRLDTGEQTEKSSWGGTETGVGADTNIDPAGVSDA